MRQRAGRDRRGTARVRLFLEGLLWASAALATGCSTLSKDSAQFEAPDYQLGGQTGSLIPGCGIAPLSAGGQSVPVGRSLAVFYAKDCPQLAAEGQLALSGVAGNAQQLELVRIADGTYLLQSAQSLPAGHAPELQTPPPHCTPHVPQFSGSVVRFAQLVPQVANPAMH